MPEVIIDGRGSASTLLVNPDGSINVSGTFAISGAIHIGSVSANVDSIYIQSGNNLHLGSAWSRTGSVVISGGIVGSFAVTNVPSGISLGYSNNQIIRKDSGSPAVNYVFSTTTNSVLIDNLGSSPIYFIFDATANPANSGTGFIPEFESRFMDVVIGSVSIQGSGTTSPSVQVIRIS